MKKMVKYEVQGMTCGGCQRSVVSALQRAGIEVGLDDVSLVDATVQVDESAPEPLVRQVIEEAGYDVGRRVPA